MTQMQRSSQQIERALERVKIIQRGAGTLVRPLLPPLCPFRENGKPCSSAERVFSSRSLAASNHLAQNTQEPNRSMPAPLVPMQMAACMQIDMIWALR